MTDENKKPVLRAERDPDDAPRGDKPKRGKDSGSRKGNGNGKTPAGGKPARKRRSLFGRLVVFTLSLGFLGAIVGVLGIFAVLNYYGQDLPDHTQLAEYDPPVATRIYAGDGRLITEYAVQRRVFVPVEAMPRQLIDAFISAEDQNFYSHPGLDFKGLARAVLTNVKNYGTGRRPEGASTITQQVAKNFLLTNEVSIERKIKEAILSFRIEQAFSKDHILELYLNEIYLGGGSYGVSAAALNYFNKSLDQLSIGEIAYLAALPKAPNNYNPYRNREAAIERRNWVIGRMLEDGHITAAEAERARAEPLTVRPREDTELVENGAYFAEEVRRELQNRYGDKGLYEGGLAVRTSLDPELQSIATRVMREGLLDYDRRHGWRGPVAHLDDLNDWPRALRDIEKPAAALEDWRLAVVLEVSADAARIGLSDHAGTIPFEEAKWARKWLEKQRYGAQPKDMHDVLEAGDVVLVEPVAEEEAADGAPEEPDARAADSPSADATDTYALRQVPDINGALVAMDPHTGRVLAMVGGFSLNASEFNRATQAWRQPGSAFKPFVYMTALANGYTPASIILDAPVEFDQGPGLPKWKPKNYSGEYYGPSTLRIGIEKSRNLMTVRLAHAVGMDAVADTAVRFGVFDDMPELLSYSLGAGETTVLRMTTAYAQIVNGGKKITPTLIDRVQDRTGRTVFRHDDRACTDCKGVFWTGQGVPSVPDAREQVIDPVTAYQMTSILEGVVKRGTGRRIAELGIPLAGKTGTTNDSLDTWFMGFSPDLVVGVFVGFDDPRTLGPRETGSSVAAPIFKDFMAAALDGKKTPFRIPPGVQLVRVSHDTGRPAMPGDTDVILEAFKPGQTPYNQRRLDGMSYAVDPGGVGDDTYADSTLDGLGGGAGGTTGTGGLSGSTGGGMLNDRDRPTASGGGGGGAPQAGGLY
ncbi:penicillin-binding protein 1A [Caenispirillum salinarum]|uniref:penicillin-binding protein 1A n=1 Tax=Caenispirillum salinarum TaxID=859058 RepID=UPI003850D63F